MFTRKLFLEFPLFVLASICLTERSAGQSCIVEQAKLVASDGEANDFFGATLSVDGDTLIVGARGGDDHGFFTGAAYVFVRSGTSWSQQAKLLASDGQAFDGFGSAVAVSGDTALVGASGVGSAGAAYVFVRNGTIWTQKVKLEPTGATAAIAFGGSVALDGDTAVVGAPFDVQSGPDSGSVYVFVRNGTSWTQQAKLLASPGGSGDEFGTSVAIDGDTLLAGAPMTDDAVLDSGSAFVFVRSGTAWSQQAEIESADSGVFDQYASSVALSGDTAVIGAFADDDLGDASGSAYVFVRHGTNWKREAELLASDGTAQDQFGNAVAVSADTIVVGARFDDDAGNLAGSAYVFVREAAGWSERAKLFSSDISSFDNFGASVAADGGTLVGGADRIDSVTGAAYVFVPPAESGVAYCTCPVGPCGNADPAAGCANSTGSGALLVAYGSTLPDEVELVVHGAVPGQFAAFFQADGAVMLPFGDGFRCADGGVVFFTALPVQTAFGGTLRYGPCAGDPSISSVTGVVPGSGDTKRYQLWYRDPGGPCGSNFNLSNGYEITW